MEPGRQATKARKKAVRYCTPEQWLNFGVSRGLVTVSLACMVRRCVHVPEEEQGQAHALFPNWGVSPELIREARGSNGLHRAAHVQQQRLKSRPW